MKSVCVFVALFISSLQLFAQYKQQQVNYFIDVELLDKENALNGFERIEYTNHSDDTLYIIKFHIWPNAYKNDRTAFSEQMLKHNNTRFYFSSENDKGYLNKLNFSVNNHPANFLMDSMHADIGTLVLNEPLHPGKSITITTNFYVKFPAFFSRLGHIGDFFMATQWYPKPAVYKNSNWYAMPYLDQGEFFSEFGNFQVNITVPDNYMVAASGNLKTEPELSILKKTGSTDIKLQPNYRYFIDTIKRKASKQKKAFTDVKIKSSSTTKTLQYVLNNAHDFAWFAGKNLIVRYDTIQIQDKIIDAFAFYFPWMESTWKNSLSYTKDAIKFYSGQLIPYPYETVSIVGIPSNGSWGGMEYPSISAISNIDSPMELDQVIAHEIGHNWFYGMVANNERRHPWMDEGMNSFYEDKYMTKKYGSKYFLNEYPKFLRNKMSESLESLALRSIIHAKKDQLVSTPSEKFSEMNYGLIAYTKTAKWLSLIENKYGTEAFQNAMKKYVEEWKFKHPGPEDFEKVLKQNLQITDSTYALIHKTGYLENNRTKKKLKPAFLFSLKETNKYQYISFSPAAGYNLYDGLMLGGLLHNYQLPLPRLHFFGTALMGTRSNQFNHLASVGYVHYLTASRFFEKIEIGLNSSSFSNNMALDSNDQTIYSKFHKLVPHIKLFIKNSLQENTEKYFDFRTFLITESGFDYHLSINKQAYRASLRPSTFRYINQLSFVNDNYRKLYPYNYIVQLQHGEGFYRLQATGNYFFNYVKGGGLKVRVFAAKFGYLNNPGQLEKYRLAIYQPKLTAVRGDEDYTYSNYFLARNEFEGKGIASQQIMIRDGGLKLRTDLFQGLQGKSDNWIAAINFSSSIPKNILPLPLPLHIFFDVGTYAEAWKKDAATSRFLYVAGLELPIFNAVTVYAPVLYSKEFNSITTTEEYNSFFKRISFVIHLNSNAIRNIKKVVY